MAKSPASKPNKSKTKTTPYDVTEYLKTPEDMAAYLDAWLDEAPDDAAGIARALGDIARANAGGRVAPARGHPAGSAGGWRRRRQCAARATGAPKAPEAGAQGRQVVACRGVYRAAWLESAPDAALAQLVEHPPCKREGVSSNPTGRTIT